MMGSLTGQQMPSAGSFQAKPDSAPELYTPEQRYSISAKSERTQKPRAKPAGAQIWVFDSAVISLPNHLPRVGEPFRISTATRKAAPCVTRINLPMGGSH